MYRFDVYYRICTAQTSGTGSSFYGPEVQYLELWQDDFADYCVLNDFDVAWSFSFGGLTGAGCFFHLLPLVRWMCPAALRAGCESKLCIGFGASPLGFEGHGRRMAPWR